MKTKTYNLNISKQIDVNFRNYALYVLENRGIPSFDDGLTNVQRFVLVNAPTSFNKTISLVGKCIADGYHHGDSSLVGAINKLARPFGNSTPILQGDGFFGSPVDSTAAAARYTSVRIEPKIAEMIRKNSFLNKKNDADAWDSLWLDLPIGLTTMIVGIAVGYKTTVLPRKLEDIQKYIDGKIKEVKPYFVGFAGKVTRYKNLDKSWLIEGKVDVNDRDHTLRITDLPPMMKYSSFLRKLNSIIENYPNASVTNNSSTTVDILIKHRGTTDVWNEIRDFVEKSTKMLVTETPVFVKNGLVINYDRIEDYINDYKYRIAELRLRRIEYFLNKNNEELMFQRYKKEYLSFMLKSKQLRPTDEIDNFLSSLTDNTNVLRRLNAILLKSLSEEEYQSTVQQILKLELEIIEQEKEFNAAKFALEGMEDTSLRRATQNKKMSTKNLMDEEPSEIDGILLYNNDDESDDE